MLLLGQKTSANRRALPVHKSSLITVLDVGTTKVCCIIARLHPKADSVELSDRTHAIEVIGFGHQRSRGMKIGAVVDLKEAEKAIRLAVDAAERRAGITVESLIVNVSGGRLQSHKFAANVNIVGSTVSQADVARVLRASRMHEVDPIAAVLHSLPIGYSIDGNVGMTDPRGMIGHRLSVDMHMVTVNDNAVRNLESAINRCHLAVEAFISTPYCSGLACLAGDESELGVVCIDMGGGTTTVSVFDNGRFVHCDGLAIGGQHVTVDLARGLSTSLQNAELIKVKHGSVLPGEFIELDPVNVRMMGDESGVGAEVSLATISKIIRPRLVEIFELVRDRLYAAGFAGVVGRRVVLTGGASQLTGADALARAVISKNVRLGRPLGVAGLPMEARSAAFSTVIGLMIYPQVEQASQDMGWSPSRSGTDIAQMTGPDGYFGRVKRWLAESF